MPTAEPADLFRGAQVRVRVEALSSIAALGSQEALALPHPEGLRAYQSGFGDLADQVVSRSVIGSHVLSMQVADRVVDKPTVPL